MLSVDLCARDLDLLVETVGIAQCAVTTVDCCIRCVFFCAPSAQEWDHVIARDDIAQCDRSQ